jgi:hypothetical protein
VHTQQKPRTVLGIKSLVAVGAVIGEPTLRVELFKFLDGGWVNIQQEMGTIATDLIEVGICLEVRNWVASVVQ